MVRSKSISTLDEIEPVIFIKVSVDIHRRQETLVVTYSPKYKATNSPFELTKSNEHRCNRYLARRFCPP